MCVQLFSQYTLGFDWLDKLTLPSGHWNFLQGYEDILVILCIFHGNSGSLEDSERKSVCRNQNTVRNKAFEYQYISLNSVEHLLEHRAWDRMVVSQWLTEHELSSSVAVASAQLLKKQPALIRRLTSEFHRFQATWSCRIFLQRGGFLKFLPGHTHHMLEIFAGKSPSNVTCQHWFHLTRVQNYFQPAVMAIFISINLLTEYKHLLRVTSLVCPVSSKVSEKWMPAWPLLSSLANSNCSLRDHSFDPACPCQICLVMAWKH